MIWKNLKICRARVGMQSTSNNINNIVYKVGGYIIIVIVVLINRETKI